MTVTADTILRTSFRSLAARLTSLDPSASGGAGIDAMQIDGGDSAAAAAGAPQLRDPGSAAFQERILASILDDYIYHSRTEVFNALILGSDTSCLQKATFIQN